MTICVAACAKDGDDDVIILVSDRMITIDVTREYLWGEQTKSFWFSGCDGRIAALTAGNPNIALEVCRQADTAIANIDNITVTQTAEIAAQKFREIRASRNEQRILSPHGLTYETLTEHQNQLAPSVLNRIVNQLCGEEGDLGADLIIAGLEPGGGSHIYLVSDPGVVDSCDSEGFAAIGLGREHAQAVFAESDWTPHHPWAEAVFTAYSAKVRSEVAPGVSASTDIYWIKQDGVGYVAPVSDMMKTLEGAVKRLEDKRRRDFRSALEKVEPYLLKHPAENWGHSGEPESE